MLDFPEIRQQEMPPLLIMTQHRLGGVGKSLVAHLLAEASHRSLLSLWLYDNDGQQFLKPYGQLTRLLLAATEIVVNDPLADIRAHEALDQRLHMALPNDILLYDGAASSINRHTYAVDQLDFGPRLEAIGRYAMIAIPVTTRPDIARDALVAFEIWRDLLPSPHIIVPFISNRDGDVRNVSPGHDLRKLVKMANDGVVVIPPTPMAIINEIRLSGLTLGDMADPRKILEIAKIAESIGQNPTIFQLMRRASAKLITETDGAMRRLGFTLGLS
ncbi:hypothetical protein [Devosia sp. Leaf64]|uniref:hypothetical protein n=1 Tax=Devosia sp. Leaf64 TaxID=1736229 RepID=UPI000713CE84|nr:hypothetical protein [Devosia sp. Leaf64]KQN73480.1 hypothetical protein ASE94_06505 [Devosia sp. Leaf64]